MSEKLKRNFETLEEAMSSLPKSTYEHSVRVGSYLQILFLQACADEELYPNDPKVQARLKENYAELVRQIGYYHDVGKAKVAEEYQNNSADFSREERALYERHAGDSMAMIETFYRKENKCKSYEANYVSEAIAFHHELWNGNGFPNRISGKNIPLFARMLALVDKMDHLFCETRSEHPFEDTMEFLYENKDEMFDPALIPTLKRCARKIKKVFTSNLNNTRIIPALTSFVGNLNNRPVALWYRPIEERATGKTKGVEAEIRFKGKKLWLNYADVEDVICRENLRKDLGIYVTLEACDALRRFDVCGIPADFLALQLPSRWFNHRAGAGAAVLSCIEESGVDPHRICVVVGKDDFRESRTNLKKNLQQLKNAGCIIALDQLILEDVPVIVYPEEAAEDGGKAAPKAPEVLKHDRKKEVGLVTIDEILEIAPHVYRIGPDDAAQEDNDAYVAALKKLVNAGIMIAAQNVEAREHKGLLYDLQVETVTGDFAGEARLADDYVKAELAVMEN